MLLLKSYSQSLILKYVGRSKEQVDEYLANVIKPILDSNKEELGMKAEINV